MAWSEQIEHSRPDLLVMGSHGRSGASRLLMGSVAENLVRDATCPVLIVPQRAVEKPVQIRTILCPVNFTETARSTALAAADMAAAFDADLLLLYSLEDKNESRESARQRLCQWTPGDTPRQTSHAPPPELFSKIRRYVKE